MLDVITQNGLAAVARTIGHSDSSFLSAWDFEIANAMLERRSSTGAFTLLFNTSLLA